MKKLFLFSILILLQSVEARAQLSMGMTESGFLAQAESDANLQSNMMERLELLDINSDKAISATEMEEMIKGTDIISSLSEDEKKATAANIKESFAKADVNKDNMLRGDEQKEFGKSVQVFLLKQQFRKMDRNGDGIYNLEDIPPMEESLKMLEDAVKKMQETVERVNAMDEDELAQNFIQSIGSSVAKEDYYQMDKNHDNCVTKDEYADYHLQQQEREYNEDETEGEKIVLTRADYLSTYKQEKKANPDCLTLDEYVASIQNIFNNMNDTFDTEDSDEDVAEWSFAKMDKDNDGKLTEQEYVDYEKSTIPSKEEKDQDYIDLYKDIFKTIEGAEKGWLTKDEYVKHFVEIGTDSEDAVSEN